MPRRVGADGVRLADVNGDRLPDITTGWEEGGQVRVYLHPGLASVRSAWPAVTVGQVPSVEDSVLVDLDRDGATDVVSCAEGQTRSMFVHWAPRDPARYLLPEAWSTQVLPASRDLMAWMFCTPLQVDGKHGLDLVAAGKGPAAALGWWEAPADPRRLEDWKWHALRPVGWIMSLVAEDMDSDGDPDILATDRKGKATGCFWLENPGPGVRAHAPWREHAVGGQGREMMFLTVSDLHGDRLVDVISCAKPQEILIFKRLSRAGNEWQTSTIPMLESSGRAKAVQCGDLNADGVPDLVFTCESADRGKSGVMALLQQKGPQAVQWEPRDISGPDGIKHDRVELRDLDRDGDLDLLTCEETRGLGVFWYEHPGR